MTCERRQRAYFEYSPGSEPAVIPAAIHVANSDARSLRVIAVRLRWLPWLSANEHWVGESIERRSRGIYYNAAGGLLRVCRLSLYGMSLREERLIR